MPNMVSRASSCGLATRTTENRCSGTYSAYVAIGRACTERPWRAAEGRHWHPSGHEDDPFRFNIGEVLRSELLDLIFERRSSGARDRNFSARTNVGREPRTMHGVN